MADDEDDRMFDYRGDRWTGAELAAFLLRESGEFDDEDRDFYDGAGIDALIAVLADRYGLDRDALDDFDVDVVPRAAPGSTSVG